MYGLMNVMLIDTQGPILQMFLIVSYLSEFLNQSVDRIVIIPHTLSHQTLSKAVQVVSYPSYIHILSHLKNQRFCLNTFVSLLSNALSGDFLFKENHALFCNHKL